MFASLVLAAGKGSRLRPLTLEIPKPALPVLDVPLAAYALERVADLGPAALNLSYKSDVVTQSLAQDLGHAAPEIFFEGSSGIGTARTVAALRGRVADPLVVWNADALADVDPHALIDAHQRSGRGLTLAVRPTAQGADLLRDAEGIRFIDRRTLPATPGFIYIGVLAVSRDALANLHPDGPPGLAEALFRPLAAEGGVALFAHPGYALDVGTPARYLAANLDVLYGRMPRISAAGDGTIHELDDGRAFFGHSASIPQTTAGPGAVIMSHATIGEGAWIENAVVLPGEHVPAGHHLVDAIFAGGSSIGARAPGIVTRGH